MLGYEMNSMNDCVSEINYLLQIYEGNKSSSNK